MPDLPLEDSPESLDEFGPIFIIGCPRSGTTFLSGCLAAIDGVEVFTGPLVAPRLLHIIANAKNSPEKDLLLWSIRDVFWQSFWRRRLFTSERVSEFVKGNISLKEFVSKNTLVSSSFVYKEPFLCFAAEDVARHFPKAKFLHIIRDGRDNADSLERSYPEALSDRVLQSERLARNKISEIGTWRLHNEYVIPWWINKGQEDQFIGYSRYERFVLLWKEMTERGRALVKSGSGDRYVEIRYEDLVTSPLEVIDHIIGFIGYRSNTRVKKRALKASRESIGISKKHQDSAKIASANNIAGELLTHLGYQI